ncbi:MAG: hypothetical protein ACYTF0_07840, partial [Planctomycetota bacterium]
GFLDGGDDAPRDANPTQDLDDDGIDDRLDSDRDGDGVANDSDEFPDDASRWQDTTNLSDLVSVSHSAVTVSEMLTSSDITVVLTSAPTADVRVPLNHIDQSEFAISGSTLNANNELVFTTATWNVAQTVTISGLDDLESDDNQSVILRLNPLISADPTFAGADPRDVMVTCLDDRGYIISHHDGRKTSHVSLAAAISESYKEANFPNLIQIDELVVGGYGAYYELSNDGAAVYFTADDTFTGRNRCSNVGHSGSGQMMAMPGIVETDAGIAVLGTTIFGPGKVWLRIEEITKVYRLDQIDLPHLYVGKDRNGNIDLYDNRDNGAAPASRRSQPTLSGGKLYGPLPSAAWASDMAEGDKFYTWDTHYFYDTPEKMYKDAVINAFGPGCRAVNADAIYIHPYQWRDNRVPSAYSADDYINYIRTSMGEARWDGSDGGNGSLFRGNEQAVRDVVPSEFNIAVMFAVSKTETGWGLSDEGWQDKDPFNHGPPTTTDADANIRHWHISWGGHGRHYPWPETQVIGRKGVGYGRIYNGAVAWAMTAAGHYYYADRTLGGADGRDTAARYTIYGIDSNNAGTIDDPYLRPINRSDEDGDGIIDSAYDKLIGPRSNGTDSDGDGAADWYDLDDDNDGVYDVYELRDGTDPLSLQAPG